MSLWSPRLLEPADLVRAATRLLERPFVEEYGDAPWLAISLPPNDEGMTAALMAAHQSDQKTPRAPQAIEFHTQMETATSVGAKEKRPAKGGVALEDLTRLLGDRCFFGAVCKRLDGGGALGERVSVGRAMNKDIVLRHSSISKFHAYLEREQREPRDGGVWTVTDAGSTNGTSVGGARLGAKESRRLQSGERVTFGSIQTVFLDARTVYQLLRAA
ncbi:MAG: FHA domain-containing protein [Polyangiaceae bacterium]